ncbi:MAG: UDP-glucose 4-epimerase [Patiriisocius sp.]|jgi:UDP-glucose 4-epimerase
MKYLVTGSSGHLGEALVRTLTALRHEVVGIDVKPSKTTTLVGSIADRGFVEKTIHNVDAVLHPATLHKPHVVTHSYQDFVETNISSTLNLLESAITAGVSRFVFTSTTSAHLAALDKQ